MLNKASLLVRNKFTLLILVVIISIHGLILTKLIYLPYPELFIYPYLTNIGLKPYLQILDQHFPGLLFLPINFNNLGMVTPEIARIWTIAIVVINQILLFLIGKKLLGSPARALMVNVLYLIWQPFLEGWVLWIDNFLPLFLLPAYYFLERRVFLGGLFLGMAVVFKQTIFPLSGLVFLYLLWKTKSLRPPATYLAGLLIPITLTIIYLASIGVLGDFWYWTIVFNLTTYAQFGTKVPPSVGFVTRILFIFGSAFTLLFLFSEEKQSHGLFKKNYATALLVFLIGSLIGVFDRADFVHFQPALPFAVLATAVVFFTLPKQIWARAAFLTYAAVALWWLGVFYKGHVAEKIFFYDDQTKSLVGKIQNYTEPGEKIFAFGTIPSIYQMTSTRPAGDIFVFQFPWFLKVSEGRILEGIKQDKPNIVVSDRLALIEGEKISDFAKDIEQYINQNYREIDKVGDTKILRRNRY